MSNINNQTFLRINKLQYISRIAILVTLSIWTISALKLYNEGYFNSEHQLGYIIVLLKVFAPFITLTSIEFRSYELNYPLMALSIILRIFAFYISITIQTLLKREDNLIERIIHLSCLVLPLLSLIMDAFPYKKHKEIIT